MIVFTVYERIVHCEKLDRLLDLILYFMHGYEVYNDGDLENGVLS